VRDREREAAMELGGEERRGEEREEDVVSYSKSQPQRPSFGLC